MPELNWDTFRALPGDVRRNFERLCRASAFHAYHRYGRFAATAQQPGVEFHLNIEGPGCSLGDPGRWYGWQCKWWDLPSGTAIGVTRKEDVVASISATKRHVSGITDWVLWTRRPLTTGDQEWFYGLDAGMRLHLWTEDNLDQLLLGDAALLREAYFGDLILTPDRLADAHQRAAAAVGDRWTPEVHQPSDAERHLRRMLAERDPWEHLKNAGSDINRFAAAVTEASPNLDEPLAGDVAAIVATGSAVTQLLDDAYQQLSAGEATMLASVGRQPTPEPPPAFPVVLRRLRGRQHPAALNLTNLIAFIREALPLVEDVQAYLTTSLAVVAGDAGYGKTQLAAQITAPTAARPAGVLLHGRHLTRHGTLDDLARQFNVAGTQIGSFEGLLAAVDAAAARARCRLPLVIDGINEAEHAIAWAPLLRTLLVTLERYPSVLVVSTVRNEFRDLAIPDEVHDILTIDGFDEDLNAAIFRYFEYYKIDPGDAELPREILNHPLSLKIYCSVANPEREHPVGVERLPESLTGMFDQYLIAAGRRIAELIPTIQPHDVTRALDKLGTELWQTRTRDISQVRVQELLGDTTRLWQDSLLSALEHDGIVIRQPNDAGAITVSLVYDMLAGHVIATSLLNANGSRVAGVLGQEATTTLFAGDYRDRHPLAGDIFEALVGKMPRAGAPQLWQVVEEGLRPAAVYRAAGLEADFLDAATIDEIAAGVDVLRGSHDIFDRLYTTRAAPRHPLNAAFLDRILHDRPVAVRDLRWTEWLRAHRPRLRADAEALAARWREQSARTDADRLRGRWLMWTLTSTDRDLRDAATAGLYWYGRHDADGLFAMAGESLTINDPYVSERMTAAAFGVATAHQLPNPTFEAALATYLAALLPALTGPSAASPTSHALIRYYVTGTFNFAHRFYPAALPAGTTLPLTFAAGPAVVPLPEGDPRREEVGRTLRMDFRNYTLGRLFPDRGNYDFDHSGHQAAADEVLGVVHALGWRGELFDDIERRIDERPRYDDPAHVERYGKKFGWIGFYTVAGVLADRGQLPTWLEVDIDPTFPQPPPRAPVALASWARRTPADDARWLREGIVRVPDSFLSPASLDTDPGPWLLAHAELEVKDPATGRNTFGLINTVLIDQADLVDVLDELNVPDYPGRSMIDVPSDYYVFAGEIPWNDRFASPEHGYTVRDIYRDTVHRSGRGIPIERVAHHYAWESYHSSENQAGAYIPSKLLSEAFDLRSVPASFDQVEPSSAVATRSFAAPPGFTGQLLYLRADLVRSYAEGRAIVTFAWGERRLQLTWPDDPTRAAKTAYESRANVWRIIKQH